MKNGLRIKNVLKYFVKELFLLLNMARCCFKFFGKKYLAAILQVQEKYIKVVFIKAYTCRS